MSGEVFYRDQRAPRDVRGPFSADELLERARDGRLRPQDEISLDGQNWFPATQHDPPLFVEQTIDSGPPKTGWQLWAFRVQHWLRTGGDAIWEYLKRVGLFYWSNFPELRQLATEYITFLQDPGNRKEIRVSADDHNEQVYLYGDRWTAELPDCCVVCGEDADCDWNSEHRSVPDLSWALLAPIIGLGCGVLGWIFLWSAEGRWLIPLGLVIGFLVGYHASRETIVAIRFRRCREHLNRRNYPSLRIFRKTLIIGVGDRKVWRKFHYGERGLETPGVPPDFVKMADTPPAAAKEGDGRPSYPTIPLVGDDESDSSPG